MLETSPIALRTDFAQLSIFALLVLGFVVGFALRRKTPVTLVSANQPVWRYFGELGWLTAPAVVATTFLGISGSGIMAPGKPDSVNTGLHTTLTTQTPPLGVIPVSTDDRTAIAGDRQAQRPGWVEQSRLTDGVGERVVIASQQYTTKEEAEKELLASATTLLGRDLQQLRPGVTRPANWSPQETDIKQHMVKQQYVEVVDRDFGNFVHPMYRVWWQVELSPEVRTEFLPEWRQASTVNRIRRVGIVVSSIALAASLMAIYRRLDILTQGARRMQLRAVTGAAAGLWVVAIRVVSERWL